MTDSEEAISDITRRFEREKMLLIEENKKLSMELDAVSVIKNSFTRRHIWAYMDRCES